MSTLKPVSSNKHKTKPPPYISMTLAIPGKLSKGFIWFCGTMTTGYSRSHKHTHCAKKPVTTMLTYPWKCTVLHCNHLGNTWKPLVLMTRHFDYCLSAVCAVILFPFCRCDTQWHKLHIVQRVPTCLQSCSKQQPDGPGVYPASLLPMPQPQELSLSMPPQTPSCKTYWMRTFMK